MISFLHGTLAELTPPHICLDVGGVGYEIDLPVSHLTQLPALGQVVTIFTHLIIREDAHLLFGFSDKVERDCFRQIIKISGIGPKIALALLSAMTSQQLHQAIETGDLTSLCRTPGIGKKMAERMLLELKGKLNNTNYSYETTNVDLTSNSIRNDLEHALHSLGYVPKEILQVIKQLPELNDLNQGIKEALKLLSKHP